MEWAQVQETAPGLGARGPLPQHRDIAFVILVGIFTFGIYTLYWLYRTYKETHECVGKDHKAGLALGFGIAAIALFFVAFISYMIASFSNAFGGPSAAGIGAMFGAFGFLMLAGLAMTGIQVWMLWGAAHGAELVMGAYGKKPDLPPILHALLPIVVNVWVYVAMGLVQNDLNKLHPN